jgi:hypothetical protein
VKSQTKPRKFSTVQQVHENNNKTLESVKSTEIEFQLIEHVEVLQRQNTHYGKGIKVRERGSRVKSIGGQLFIERM